MAGPTVRTVCYIDSDLITKLLMFIWCIYLFDTNRNTWKYLGQHCFFYHSLIFIYFNENKLEFVKIIKPGTKFEYCTGVIVLCKVWFDKSVYFAQIYAVYSCLAFGEQQ